LFIPLYRTAEHWDNEFTTDIHGCDGPALIIRDYS
jgi:hypothetical protein